MNLTPEQWCLVIISAAMILSIATEELVALIRIRRQRQLMKKKGKHWNKLLEPDYWPEGILRTGMAIGWVAAAVQYWIASMLASQPVSTMIP